LKVLSTTELSMEIENLFKSESEYLILLSPYLQITKKLMYLLSSPESKIYIFYRECNNLNEMKRDLPRVCFINAPELHAKVYLTESTAIIASLNLYEYSQINNFEIGVSFTKADDLDNYKKLLQEIIIMSKANNSEMILNNLQELSEDEYTMRRLYSDLQDKYGFKRRGSDQVDKEYNLICDIMRDHFKFYKSQLYIDETAILRSTPITKEMYNFGMKNIKF